MGPVSGSEAYNRSDFHVSRELPPLPSWFILLQSSVHQFNFNISSSISIQHYPLVISSCMYPCNHVGVFAHLHSEGTLAVECVATACIVVVWVPDITGCPHRVETISYLAVLLRVASIRPVSNLSWSMSYLGRWLSSASSHSVNASPGNSYYLLTGLAVRCLIAGDLSESEMINGPRLCPDVWL